MARNTPPVAVRLNQAIVAVGDEHVDSSIASDTGGRIYHEYDQFYWAFWDALRHQKATVDQALQEALKYIMRNHDRAAVALFYRETGFNPKSPVVLAELIDKAATAALYNATTGESRWDEGVSTFWDGLYNGMSLREAVSGGIRPDNSTSVDACRDAVQQFLRDCEGLRGSRAKPPARSLTAQDIRNNPGAHPGAAALAGVFDRIVEAYAKTVE